MNNRFNVGDKVQHIRYTDITAEVLAVKDDPAYTIYRGTNYEPEPQDTETSLEMAQLIQLTVRDETYWFKANDYKLLNNGPTSPVQAG